MRFFSRSFIGGVGVPMRPHLVGLPTPRVRPVASAAVPTGEGAGGNGDRDGQAPTSISLPAFTMGGSATVVSVGQVGTALALTANTATVPSGTYLNFSNQPFTLEFMLRRAAAFEMMDRRTGPIYQNFTFDSRSVWYFTDTTAMWDGSQLGNITADTAGAFRHIAVTRDSTGDFRLFDNGVLVNTRTDHRTKSVEDAAVALRLAVAANTDQHIGGIRITKGTGACRYKQPFTPFNTQKFPTVGDPYGNLVTVLLNFNVAPGTAASTITNGQ